MTCACPDPSSIAWWLFAFTYALGAFLMLGFQAEQDVEGETDPWAWIIAAFWFPIAALILARKVADRVTR